MRKIIFCNLDLLRIKFDGWNDQNLTDNRNAFLDYANKLCLSDNNYVWFISREQKDLTTAEEHFNSKGYTNFVYKNRATVKDFIQKNKDHNNYFVFISGKEIDFRLAVNTKSLFIVPTWIRCEDKATHYGVKVDTPSQLFKFMKTLNNQNNWFTKLEIGPKVTCISLMDARYGCYANNLKEKDMLLHFEKLLKEGKSRNYYEILLYHFLAGITNITLFDDIELFGMIPSSDCSLNKYMFQFMTQVRYIKNKRLPKNGTMKSENILLRHREKAKAHEKYQGHHRMNMGAIDEFSTICINPEFRDKINRLRIDNKFNVCIFDDYITHGNSFNAARNLLESIGANKIIFVSLGSFAKPFQKKNYTILGDVYESDYKYSLDNSQVLNHKFYNESAKEEVAELYEIFNAQN